MKNRRAKVVYSYAPQNDDELKLDVDDVIEVLDEIEDGWWKGISPKGITGVFPSNFVVEVAAESPKITKKESEKSDNESIDGSKSSLSRDGSIEKKIDNSLERKPKPINKIGFGDIFAGGKPKLSPIGDTSLDRNKNLPKKPPPQPPASEPEAAPKLPPKPVREQAVVLYSYTAQNEDELTIKEGEIINIVSKEIEDVGWWKGELNGRIALFPDNFVEIKSADDLNSLTRVKNPGRPAEKPPAPKASNLSSNAPNQPKPESNKISNKPSDELPKNNATIGSNSSSSAPVIPGKKPKVLNSSYLSKPKPEPTQTTTPSSVKPDVVPQENGSKQEVDTNNKSIVSANGAEDSFVDSTANKLTHLTANRAKGPSSRRPPSTIFIPKDSLDESKENGDISAVVSTKVENNVTANHSNEQPKPVTQLSQTQTPPVPSDKPVEKLPPWMLELRKAQEKRKENPEDSPKGVPSPTKSSPNRFSGDFTNKSIQNTSADENDTNSVHTFTKPTLKPTKPNIISNVVTSASPTVTETPTPVAPTPPLSRTTNIVSNNSPVNTSTATTVTPITTTTTSTPKVDDCVTNLANDKRSTDQMEKQIRELKESTVSRKEFEELSKQVTELREAIDTQKLTYSKTIRDLINDVADEQKKVANLQIEIERLRKLTTTV